MNIAYITEFDINSNQNNWQRHQIGHWGRCYYMAKSLEDELTTLHYLGPLTKKDALLPKIKSRLYNKVLKQNYHAWAEPIFNKDYARQIETKLSNINADVVVSPDLNFLAYLEWESSLILWVDTLYTGLINYYVDYMNLCQETIQHLREMDRLTLNKCTKVIFSSDWMAKKAIETYQVEPGKINIVPFGANIECNRTIEDINNIVKTRPKTRCKLLFIGVDWVRKGGKIALEVAKELNKAGLNAELTIVGCQPIANEPIPKFVKYLGFIDKSKKEGIEKLNYLLAESHFLILPSQAECYGHVFCEANSFGLPCLATDVGGIPSIIKDNLNGKTFPLTASIADYCTYIFNLMNNYRDYEKLAISSFNEYQTRLNWTVAGQTVKNILRTAI
ncbi:glycosyltransferase family 4 protein [Microseira wollei]|uniref:Glycosyl transferase group 1 n=1 Tax=Microseira wollei NIES-4236 TaxID=2530354 RepID=A0AAV3WN93_9CYAN|nr:glycosyltransferase family 4 protein [Microseira wollei]GET43209.1 glycosyl transferase group 1 [Microseira wollei NIES-4236]